MDHTPNNQTPPVTPGENHLNKAAVRCNRKEIQLRIIELLEKGAPIGAACSKVGISRMTHNRWVRANATYRRSITEALGIGDDSVNDLAESKLIERIKDGDMQAIRYRLSRCHPKYPEPASLKTVIIKNNLDSDDDQDAGTMALSGKSAEKELEKARLRKEKREAAKIAADDLLQKVIAATGEPVPIVSPIQKSVRNNIKK